MLVSAGNGGRDHRGHRDPGPSNGGSNGSRRLDCLNVCLASLCSCVRSPLDLLICLSKDIVCLCAYCTFGHIAQHEGAKVAVLGRRESAGEAVRRAALLWLTAMALSVSDLCRWLSRSRLPRGSPVSGALMCWTWPPCRRPSTAPCVCVCV